ncbi:MAG: WG repeat-containing protein [Bacteroidota bacterium]
MLTDFVYDYVSLFVNGYGVLQDESGGWFCDRAGNPIHDVKFPNVLPRDAIPFHFDLSIVYKKEGINWKFALIDKNAKRLTGYDYDEIIVRENYVQTKQDKKVGAINRLGQLIAPCDYDEIYDFGNGIFQLKNEEVMHFYDRDGNRYFE